MAGDLAQLGIQVDSSQAKAASGDLDKLASSAQGAQKATDGLRSSNTSATASMQAQTGATAQSTAATQALRDAIASNAAVTSEMIQAAGGWSAAQKVMADASRATASTIAKSAETQIAANDAIATSSVASAAVQVEAGNAVVVNSLAMRESLVLLREAARGNYTRMAGSASILIQSFGLLESAISVLAPIIAVVGGAFLLSWEQIRQSTGDLTKGLNLTADQLDKVKDKTVTLWDTVKATFQVLAKDLTGPISGIGSVFTEMLDNIANVLATDAKFYVGIFVGAFDGIVAVWKQLPSVLGDVFVTAANGGLEALQTLVDGSVKGINAIIEASNSMNKLFGNGTQLGLIQAPDLGQIKNEFTGAGTTAATAFSTAFKKGYADASAATTQFFTDVANQAKKDRIGDIIKEAGKAHVKALKDLTDQADNIINKYADQYEKQTKVYDDFHAKLAEEVVLAGQSADERERSVAEQKEIKLATEMGIAPQLQMVDALVQQRQEAERLQKVSQGVTTSFQDFFTTVFSGGKDAFHNLVDSIKNQFAQLLAWMVVQAIAQPIIVPVIQAVTGGALGAANLLGAGGGAAGMGNLFGTLGSVSSAGGALSGASGFLGGIGSQISSAASWLTSGINNIGASLGFSAGTSFGGISTVGVTPSVLGTGGFAAPNIAGSSSLLGGTTLTGLLGGAGLGLGVGSILSSITGGNSTGGSIGGALGGAIGSVVPVIGTLVGSIAGGLIGGLFGPGKTAGKASATFDANGVITGYGGDKATDKSTQAVQSAAQTISSVVQTLSSAGVDISNSISKLVIADNRDKSFILTASGQKQTVGTVGDPNSAIQGTLDYLLKGASSSDANISQVLKHYQATGGITSSNASQVASDIAFAKSLENISFDTTKQLSQAATALKTLNDNYQTAIDRAKSLGLSTDSLTKAQAHDVALLQKSTSDAYVAQFKGVTQQLGPQLDSFQAAAKTISDGLAQATSDMNDLGGSLTDVSSAASAAMDALRKYASDYYVGQLSAITSGFAPLSDYQQKAKDISDILTQAATDMDSLGGSLTNVTNAANQAKAALASTFNSDINTQLRAARDSTVGSFYALAETQNQRIADAVAIGGNLSKVNALNTVELQNFINSLTDAQRAALISAGTLNTQWTSYANSVSSLSDGIDSLIGRATAAGQAAQQASQAWSAAQQSLDQSRKALLISGPGVSPQNAYLAAQSQYSDLLQKAKTDPAQAQAFASFASQFLQTSLAYNATGGAYGSDFSKVQTDLASLSMTAGTQATAQNSLAASAQASLDALNAMKAQLASGQPNITLLQQQLAAQNNIVTAIEAGNVLAAQAALVSASTFASMVSANDNALVTAILSKSATVTPVAVPVATPTQTASTPTSAPASTSTTTAPNAATYNSALLTQIRDGIAELKQAQTATANALKQGNTQNRFAVNK